ncbi:hypothetical protein ASPFODRAFT_133595 [Aspergillus luchuensis CBS 106.47]|uniref:Major facilitator superfamily (MFS) profile domain-containing protein n=1 Tax=Aspergillus luchuensis (strain CBS 106.47) TaxID=1137211 RepID=A0A1M3TIE7_ASPLC|nr:hypothetical protein ASPFODRAFT_133595 [Aspergillus luchuensis CBS 106.47]
MGADLEDGMLIASPFPWTAPHLVRLNFCALSLVLFASANGYDSSMINSLQSLPPWVSFMSSPTGAWLGFITIVYWIGLLLAYTVAPYISDRFGRKIGLYIGLLFVTAGAILQGLSPNPTGWIVGRGLAGCAACFWSCNAPVLISEIAYPSHRATVSSFYQCGYYVGSTLAAWIIYGMLGNSSSWSWQIPSLLQLILPLCALPGLLLCPESPRWLLSQGRAEEAHAILTEWHAGGDRNSPLVFQQMHEIQAALKIETESVQHTSYLDMLKTKANRRRLVITLSIALFSQWGGNGVVSFYLTEVLKAVGITKSSKQLIITACLQIWNLICGISAALLVDLVGKRSLFHSSAITMTISYIMITAFTATFEEHHERSVGTAVIPFLFIYFAGYGIALTPLLIAYPCEIWQFSLRTRGLSITWISSCLFASFNSLVNPIALETISWKYYFVFLAVLIVYGITEYYMYPETKDRSLEEIQRLFESENPKPTSSRTTD